MKALIAYCFILIFINAANTLNIPILGNSEEIFSSNASNQCIFDAECRTGHFCKTHLPNIIGNCIEGKGENEFCIKSSVCASNRCSFFRCTKRIVQKDGPCKNSADCPDDQFCDNVPERPHIRECFNRKCTGKCRKNSECVTHKCRDSICIKAETCHSNQTSSLN